MASVRRPVQLALPATSDRERESSGEHSPSSDVTFRGRGVGGIFHHDHDASKLEAAAEDEKSNALAGSWWGERDRDGNRPWHNPPERKKTIPPDQEVAFERTKTAVTKATAAFLSGAAEVGHELLLIGSDALELAPIAGLDIAARILLNIWDAVSAVETNRMSCLRLTERCANILYSIRAEIGAAGPDVAETLRDPVEKLTEAFKRVEHFVHKQVSRPFLKRYLKRSEDAARIIACDAGLTDSVGLFSVAIQVRMLKELQDQHHVPAPLPPALVSPGSNEIVAAIAMIRANQAAYDSAVDVADLYAAMRSVIRSNNDAAMLDMLQVNRNDLQEAIKTLQRALEDPNLTPPRGSQIKTIADVQSRSLETPSSNSSGQSQFVWTTAPATQAEFSANAALPLPPVTPAALDPEQDAAFHREFLENGLDALRRLSGTGGGESLPPWTITRWEVDREGKIGVGFFSDVYKGTWRGRQVAIKILAPTTPRKLFRHEISIWASLKHQHVLELLGASSATGDPPWFFVSPYLKNGSLPAFLKMVTSRGGRRAYAYPGPLQLMHEIAIGMAYLHRKGVLHGDLKANNVLIDNDYHCVISDFGQSELKSEVYRLSRQPQPHGTLRWQAPEIISGESPMTPEVDVYAFAIVCVEILTNGELPWPMLDDQAVQQLVLLHNKRPKIPLRPETSLSLVSLIEECWSTDPLRRPLFDSVARGLGHLVGGLRNSNAKNNSPSPRGRVQDLIRENDRKRSPDMAPVELPDVSSEDMGQDPWAAPDPQNRIQQADSLSPSRIPLQRIVTPAHLPDTGLAQPDLEEKHKPVDSTVSSIFASSYEGSSEADHGDAMWDGYESPPPKDVNVAARRNERRYRLLLQHDFHPTLNLPLWTPSPVQLGAVGYLSKPQGRFITLFNCLNPSGAEDRRVHTLPSIYGYGAVREGTSRQDKKTIAQIGIDIIQGLLTFKKGGVSDGVYSRVVKKRYSFPLRAGHKHAYLCTENTTYRYMVDINAAKAWFKSNIGSIVKLYGKEHSIQREEVFLVIGTLETKDYGLFVSHEHPDGQVHFNVYLDRREGQDWGSFSTDSDLGPSMPGPEFGEGPIPTAVHATKVSTVRSGPDADADSVLLARLRFKPDADEPTRL